MISDIHLTGTTHCPGRVFTTHNSTPHERKISTQNMTAKGTRNMIDNILVDIETLRYNIAIYTTKDPGYMHAQKVLTRNVEKIPPRQAAYQQGRSTTEVVFNFKVLAEKAIKSKI